MNALRYLPLPQAAIFSSRKRWRTAVRPYYARYYHRPSAGYRSGRTIRRIYFVLGTLALVSVFLALRIATENRGNDTAQRLRVTAARNEVRSLSAALDHYAQDNFTYPSTQQGLEALMARPSDTPFAPNWKPGGYIKRLPMDPWGRPYQYHEPGTHGSAFDLFSLGADGKRGGHGMDADIGNWNRPS